MSYWTNPDRQIRLMMLMLDELAPGCVCFDSRCRSGEPVPHMATDAGPHPHPYGLKPPYSDTENRKRARQRASLTL